jgi:nucleotidyltransferase substrate binding protein (TIGR01987 family)
MIDITTLKQALATLEEAVRARANNPADKYVRDACIQRFEYTYELTHKMLRRYLEETEPAVREMSFPQLIRLGFARGLLRTSWDIWNDFRDARNKTSHTYDEAKAESVAALIPGFASEAAFLRDQIEARQHGA